MPRTRGVLPTNNETSATLENPYESCIQDPRVAARQRRPEQLWWRWRRRQQFHEPAAVRKYRADTGRRLDDAAAQCRRGEHVVAGVALYERSRHSLDERGRLAGFRS